MGSFIPPIRPNINALSYQDLLARGGPTSTQQPEAFRDVIYDTQSVTTTTTSLTYFNTLQTDKTLGNLAQAGALPAAQFFAIAAISCEALIPASVGAAGGPVAILDASLIFIAARPIFTLTVSDKPYGPFPLNYAGAAGMLDLQGFGNSTADTAAQALGGNGANGGYFIGNSIILMPNVQFSGTMTLAAAQASLSTSRNVRVTLHGTRYRRVV